MATPDNPLYGLDINEIARLCQVDLTTARRWKRGARSPPKSALLLIRGDLGMFDAEWRGWRIRKDKLISPEGWEITENDIRSVPLMRHQIFAYQSELRAVRAAIAIQEQPLPDSWPEWVHGIRAG